MKTTISLLLLLTTFGLVLKITYSERYGDDSTGESPVPKISGGTKASLHPFQVQILSDYGFDCSGTIINFRWILTAAHCVKGKSNFQILAGTNEYLDFSHGQWFEVEVALTHPEFSYVDTGSVNDIALIKVAKNITFSDKIWPIRLGEIRTFVGRNASIAGWGRTEHFSHSRVLQETLLRIIGFGECRKSWPLINHSHICAARTNVESVTCAGDSGGPLIIDERVIGILSFGRQGCPDEVNDPEVFTRIETYIPWIDYIMKKDQEGEFQKYAKKSNLFSPLSNSFSNVFRWRNYEK